MYRCIISFFALVVLLFFEVQAAPPGGGGGGGGPHGGGGGGGGGWGHSSGFGYSIGIGSPGGGFRIGVGNAPPGRGYYGGGYGGRGFYGGGYGNWYGGSGVYLGGGSRDFRWGVGIPFGYGDYGWYAPYYNYYHRYYYVYEPSYSSSSTYYYSEDVPTGAEQTPALEHPPVPTAGQVSRLTDDQLRMMITVALDDYNQYLDGLSTGAGWKRHFQLAALKAHVTSLPAGALDAATRALVSDISEKLDAAAKNPAYEIITQPWSFQTLQVALKEYALPALERQAHTLYAKSLTLKRSLDNVSTGGGWKAYLKLDELEQLLSQSPQNSGEVYVKLEKILERFDEVQAKPEYKAVADLPGFAVSQAGLQQYINALRAETSIPAAPPEPAGKEL
jgi:hypothetical protein